MAREKEYFGRKKENRQTDKKHFTKNRKTYIKVIRR